MASKKTAKTEKTEKAAAKPAKKAAAKTTTKTTTRPSTKAKVAVKKPVAVKKGPKPPKAEPVKVASRHPKGAVAEQFKSKEALAKQLAPTLARGDQDTDVLTKELTTASNAQLLRLHEATEELKEKYGSREKLIAAIGAAENKAKDKDFLAKLDSYSLPHLLDLAASAERRARA